MSIKSNEIQQIEIKALKTVTLQQLNLKKKRSINLIIG